MALGPNAETTLSGDVDTSHSNPLINTVNRPMPPPPALLLSKPLQQQNKSKLGK
jgi:hypothetical protein